MRRLVKRIVLLSVLVAVLAMPAGCATGSRLTDEERIGAIDFVLDDFHAAAAAADGPRYFRHFTPDAVFLGTDPTERWTLDEFRVFAEPYFSQGRGWTYVSTERHVTLRPDDQVAWFDETLENEKYGTCRGTGVLVRHDHRWHIAQYSLTFLILNEAADEAECVNTNETLLSKSRRANEAAAFGFAAILRRSVV